MRIVDTASRIEALALQTPPDLHLSRAECDRIAHLALLLAQERNRKGGSVILTGRDLIPFEQWPEESRATARRTVVRLLEALAMLGYLEPPAPEVIDVVSGE
jgi:hypothetical protein